MWWHSIPAPVHQYVRSGYVPSCIPSLENSTAVCRRFSFVFINHLRPPSGLLDAGCRCHPTAAETLPQQQLLQKRFHRFGAYPASFWTGRTNARRSIVRKRLTFVLYTFFYHIFLLTYIFMVNILPAAGTSFFEITILSPFTVNLIAQV